MSAFDDFEWEDEEDYEEDHDEEYYIHLHEKNKKYLEKINIDSSPHVRIIDRYEDNHLIEYHTSPGGFEDHIYQYVRVRDSSTGKFVFLSVPNDMFTCKDAIAWTFGLTSSEYDLFFQT